jgi:hypothetical protein
MLAGDEGNGRDHGRERTAQPFEEFVIQSCVS